MYVIAEIGSNHGGSLDAALALIDAAADAGADAAKFQLWHADHMYDPGQFPEEHASAVRWQMPEVWLPQLAQRCQLRGIDFGCSAFCFDALDAVDPYVKWHKVASIEATWGPFTKAVVAKGKPIVASLGLWENEPTWLPFEKCVFMQCSTAYPALLEDAHLRVGPYWVRLGAKAWGLSDHTTHPTIAPCAAVALGASVIEKHIRAEFPPTNDSKMWPPDWPHSIKPSEFKHMVKAIRLTEKALGSSEKRIRESEKPYLRYRRGSRGLRGA